MRRWNTTDERATSQPTSVLTLGTLSPFLPELDAAEVLDDGDPEEFAMGYRTLSDAMPQLNVFGGCCGSDLRHVTEIARTVII